jgi:hypothetical protein
MKTRQTVFCSIGLGVAGIAAVNLVLMVVNTMVRPSFSSQAHPGSFLVAILYQIVLVICLGGGGLSNFIGNRLKPGATKAMIVMYCLTCVLAPLGLWGVYELRMIAERQRRFSQIDDDVPRAKSARRRKSSFAPTAATLSWVCSVGGFIAVILAGASHVRPIILLTVAVVLLAMLVSLACGTYALCCIREQGKEGILLPALIGIAISGFFVLFLVIAMVTGGLEAMKERQARQGMNRAAPVQTNEAPSLP